MERGAAVLAMCVLTTACAGDVDRLPSFLTGGRSSAQSQLPATDPRIRAELVIGARTARAGEPIVIDLYLQNLERKDIQQRQFSPFSSMVGLPTFRLVTVQRREEMLMSPGLFAEAPGEWDNWYQPAAGRGASAVGFFTLPPGARVHLLHGDLRDMVQKAGAYCQQKLAEGTLLEQPDQAATKKHYQEVVQFARQFRAGGEYEVTAWAYARSNTVTIQVGGGHE